MGTVKIRYIGLVQNVVGNRQEELSLHTDTTVRQLLMMLVEKHGIHFRLSVLRTSGELRPTVTIHVGNRDIKELEGLDTPLVPDSEMTVIITGHPDPGG
ncbi:MAG: MoaD/ThiS family protein [Dehalococcoidia bacterium]|nr:hypothetical protein [Dehalococcoidia bacterium]MBF8304018.1 hypothetical protein [Dehalococcoidia bacterium]MDO8634941.1 MoaD/ThiS family protein [Dehalococcoidia bacterium]